MLKTSKNTKLLLIFLLILLTMSNFSKLSDSVGKIKIYTIYSNSGYKTEHEWIIIDGNADFLDYATNDGWFGTGTPTDPIIISGYIFNIIDHGRALEMKNTDLHFEFRDNIKEGLVLENLANLFTLKGEDQKAIDYYCISLDIYEKFGDKVKVAKIKHDIGKIFYAFLQDRVKSIQFLPSITLICTE